MRRSRGTALGRICALLVVMVLGGCGQPGEAPGAAPDEDSGMTGEAGDEPAYSCFGPAYPESVWAAQEPAADVEHPGREALLGELAGDGLEGWFLLEASDERLSVARERDEPQDPGDDILRTHDVLSVENLGDGDWRLAQASSCAPQRELDGLVSAQVWLDGEPHREATRVELLVMELDCASGRSAENRTRLVGLREDAEEVEIVVGIEALGGDQTCPGNPATPMVVELAEPLGERQLTDASVYPPRPLDLAPEALYRG